MPVELNITESVTELDTTVVTVTLESASEPGPAGPGVPTGGTANQVLTKDSGTDYDTSWQDAQGGGGGAPTDVDYLVGTASGSLSAEIVVGTSPGGELGGTWASPTIDATHSGSSHAAVQAAAEATAAGELASHAADTTGIHGISDTSALETSAGAQSKVDTHSADTTSVHGIADTSALALTANAVMDGDTAGGVLSGTYPNPGFAADMATQAELDAHISDSSAAHAASAVSVSSATLSGTGTDAQAVFEELDNLLDDHSARHENGGADEISVAGLSGELADAQPVTVRKNTGSDVGTRSRLNFIEGSNVTLTVSDDAGSDEVDITIAASASSDWTQVVKSSTESVSSSTAVQNDDELFFATVAGEVYELILVFFYDSPAGGATPDIKFDIGEDTTVRGQLNGIVVNTGDAAALLALAANQTNTGTAGTNAAERLIYLTGYHRGNGGTWRLRWAQNSSNPNATRVLAGSFLRYRVVS